MKLKSGQHSSDVDKLYTAPRLLQHPVDDRLVLHRVEGTCRVHQPTPHFQQLTATLQDAVLDSMGEVGGLVTNYNRYTHYLYGDMKWINKMYGKTFREMLD